jgi:hypothetical protein
VLGFLVADALASGGFVIVLRVPKSFNPPHRVRVRNTNRIYGRNSAGLLKFTFETLLKERQDGTAAPIC